MTVRTRLPQDGQLDLLELTPEELHRWAMSGPQAKERTFVSDVAVPLAQNLLGGLGMAGLCAILALALAAILEWVPDPETVSLVSWAAGGLGAAGMTVFRFWGDELGVGRRLYRMGAQSRDTEVAALHAEIDSYRNALAGVKAAGGTVRNRAAAERAIIARDARTLVALAYRKADITRKACENRGMSQGAWRKARNLLIAAKILDGSTNALVPPDASTAATLLDTYLGRIDEMNVDVTPF